MWLSFYNPVGIGDVLLLTSGTVDEDKVVTQSANNVTLIKDEATNEVISMNIFNISEHLTLTETGQVFLSTEQVQTVNDLIQQAGFDMTVTVDNRPKFVVGFVESCRPHEDSDHLNITEIKVGDDQTLQIVCGASNIAQGLKVLIALPGAVMPSGLIIWPGELRGVVSNGMVCSTRELALTHIEDLPGIWELKPSLPVGMPLAEVVESYVS